MKTYSNNNNIVSPLGNTGNSHFTYVKQGNSNSGFHVTTPIGGLKQGVEVKIHDFIKHP